MNRQSNNHASSAAIWIGMLTIYLVWGSTYLAIRFAVATIPPFLMAGIRFLIAGSLMFAWRRFRGDPMPTISQWRSGLVIGLLLLLGGNGLVSWAETRIPSGVAALLVGSSPLWMALLGILPFFRLANQQKIKPVTLLGLLVGFVGMAILVSPSGLTGIHGDIDLMGGAAVTLAAFLWAIGSLYSRQADLPDSPLMGTSLEMLCGGAGLILVATLSGEWVQFNPAAITPQSIGGLAYLIVFGSLIAFAAYTWLLRVAPTTLVSTYAYVNPMVAVFLGSVLAQEIVTPRIIIAAIIIIAAVVLITLTQPANH